ncbi:unnamed protein product [Protopolystoma xenopodis]|uniref:Uncharacterized protein n=1 Tax=Protopolystoma xenopodis TaxID=117903 RepID=A0A3S4ZXF4_9PLAT|nr:unnamed protein product [Protopolystoma xenopodis]
MNCQVRWISERLTCLFVERSQLSTEVEALRDKLSQAETLQTTQAKETANEHVNDLCKQLSAHKTMLEHLQTQLENCNNDLRAAHQDAEEKEL